VQFNVLTNIQNQRRARNTLFISLLTLKFRNAEERAITRSLYQLICQCSAAA